MDAAEEYTVDAASAEVLSSTMPLQSTPLKNMILLLRSPRMNTQSVASTALSRRAKTTWIFTLQQSRGIASEAAWMCSVEQSGRVEGTRIHLKLKSYLAMHLLDSCCRAQCIP